MKSVAIIASVSVSVIAGCALAAPPAGTAASSSSAKACSPIPSDPNVPHILSPCNGARLAPGTAVSFSIYDGDSQARVHAPLILISARRTLSDGHLIAPPPLGGDFHGLTSVTADPTRFTYTSPARQFPKWWQNTAGTYYVQIRQADARAGAPGRYYSPITTIHIR